MGNAIFCPPRGPVSPLLVPTLPMGSFACATHDGWTRAALASTPIHKGVWSTIFRKRATSASLSGFLTGMWMHS
jgi:hypothetical protein